ncbi:serine/threonine-protein kinase [Phytohabitans rumicis]|uniref:non-specific serine/threonine protein kinase n=1 Tax=Phytohabitans rumicis TaxID=1076125 RepID=A0A6V8LDK0_9ACTN|nr:serine/threonine-protein kinase [Phytohabitans rumicis]GFJ92861.1 hypothetical protein Prum_065030 [Phytohabitans rumicis]
MRDELSFAFRTGEVVGGRYRLERQLGRGATASVWQARDERLDRAAALKVLDPAWQTDPVALERLRREARSVASLAHHNLVGVYDVDVDNDVAYLAMELVEGDGLNRLIAMHRRLPVERAAAIAAQVCDALGAAHQAGVVHRDIKPANILVEPDGTAKVCDFGIAVLHRTATQSALTAAGMVVGSYLFMAPEQALGGPIDARTDLYAVGCVLYAMLTGAAPFNADSPLDVLDLHLEEPAVPLRAHRDDIPTALDELVRELLAKDPVDRPTSAWEVRDRLRAIAGQPEIPDVPTVVPADVPTELLPSGVPSGGRHRAGGPVTEQALSWLRHWLSGWVILLLVGAVVSLVAATAVLSSRGDEPAAVTNQPTTFVPLAPTGVAELGTPSPSPSPSAPTTPPRQVTPIERIGTLAAVVQEQADSGQLTAKAARELIRKLNQVARHVRAGNAEQAADAFGDFTDRVRELRANGTLTVAGYAALPDLDAIAASLHAI